MENFLQILLSDLETLPIDLRESICKRFNCSIATFHRRLRMPKTLTTIGTNFILDETKCILTDTLIKNKKKFGDYDHLKMKRNRFSIVSHTSVKLLYTTIVDLQYIFRNAILEECGWSPSKFAIKKGKAKLDLSDVEKSGIISLFNNIMDSAITITESAHKLLYRHRSSQNQVFKEI